MCLRREYTMGVPRSPKLIAGALCLALLSPFAIPELAAQGRGWHLGQTRNDYEAGYREGLRQGTQDGRNGRDFDLQRTPLNRRDDFRRGFADGYRVGYERFRSSMAAQLGDRRDVFGRRTPGGYREPASARGYSDGYEDGLNDGRRGDRYDPVASRDYRDGDNGYFSSYGSRDAYRDNYRAGFRQGYEEGYRDAGRNSR
jgi:flagellar biosynthesis/type III secretory pathway protein FliH